jgi:hypothetical protein
MKTLPAFHLLKTPPPHACIVTLYKFNRGSWGEGGRGILDCFIIIFISSIASHLNRQHHGS